MQGSVIGHLLFNLFIIMVNPVLNLWENQMGVSNIFLTYFDYFREVDTNLGIERPQRGRGVKPQPPTNRALGEPE